MSQDTRRLNRYAFERVHEAIDAFMQKTQFRPLQRAWRQAQEMIRAQQRALYPEWIEKVGMSFAWEDFEVACRGQGGPAITGAILQIWSTLPEDLDDEFRQVLCDAFEEAGDRTARTARRYTSAVLDRPVHLLCDGFAMPEATPRDPADPAEAVEEEEEDRVVEAATGPNPEAAGQVLELIQGGRSETGPSSDGERGQRGWNPVLVRPDPADA